MTTINHINELPKFKNLRAFLVDDSEQAEEIAAGRKSYLFQQTPTSLYLFVEVENAELPMR